MAYFAVFELEAYRALARFPDGLVLDLGCGDGTFAAMLREALRFEARLIGADYDWNKLARAARRRVYSQLVRLDAQDLPFESGSFDAVLSNEVLYCLRPSPKQAVAEVRRILKEDGTFICTVPTHLADQHYYVAALLARMGLTTIGHSYARRMNARMGTVSAFAPERWCRLLGDAGLTVAGVVPFISEAVSRRWSLLTLTPLRAMGALRLVPIPWIHRIASTILKRLMIPLYSNLPATLSTECSDYILIVSRNLHWGR